MRLSMSIEPKDAFAVCPPEPSFEGTAPVQSRPARGTRCGSGEPRSGTERGFPEPQRVPLADCPVVFSSALVRTRYSLILFLLLCLAPQVAPAQQKNPSGTAQRRRTPYLEGISAWRKGDTNR